MRDLTFVTNKFQEFNLFLRFCVRQNFEFMNETNGNRVVWGFTPGKGGVFVRECLDW